MALLRLHITPLEDRLTPALAFQFDYSLDTTGFFADPTRRASLEHVGRDLGSRIQSTPTAITPGGKNTWEASFNHPATGQNVSLSNLSIPAGTLLVFVGARNLPGNQRGEGGPGNGFPEDGDRNFRQAVQNRGLSGFAPWGGSLTFDGDSNFYFGDGDAGSKSEFYSTAVHELGHLLGFGTAPEFHRLSQNGAFTGANAMAVNGGPVPLGDSAHFAQGTKSGGDPVSMQPSATQGQRVWFSTLDYAALSDIGWQVAGLPVSPSVSTTPTKSGVDQLFDFLDSDEFVDDSLPDLSTALPANRLVVTSDSFGAVIVYEAQTDGSLKMLGVPFRPFSRASGPVRAVALDVNGDGIGDLAFASGPGDGSKVRIVDGRTFQDLVPSFTVFESSFMGGVFLAAGDLDGDGHDELVVSPDEGGGSRIKVFTFGAGAAALSADFFGINDPAFRGGARVAVGDLNGDKVPDLIVSAGFGGGPRVAVFDGKTALTADRRSLVADFFAFEATLRNGVYASAGDIDGDGVADLVLGAGPGGGPRVMTLSGKKLTGSGSGSALAGPLADTFAGDPDQRGGVRVTAKDLDGDGKADVVTGDGTGRNVHVYRGTNGGLTPGATLDPFAGAVTEGVYVG